MTAADNTVPLIDEELNVLSELVPPAGLDIIELGCGSAQLARTLLRRHPLKPWARWPVCCGREDISTCLNRCTVAR